MEHDFWHNKWKNNQVGFHINDVNPYLISYFDHLNPSTGDTIFVPLCGKSLDLHWLTQKGMNVIGCELSELAVKQLFNELDIIPTIEPSGQLTKYSSHNLTIFVGDIFDLKANQIGKIHAIYDRAALVALPKKMRTSYSRHITTITNNATQLLVTIKYDESTIKGPPFNINEDEINLLYPHFIQKKLIQSPISGGLKNQPAFETVWNLTYIS